MKLNVILKLYTSIHTQCYIAESPNASFRLFKEYLKFLNRLYDINWLGQFTLDKRSGL